MSADKDREVRRTACDADPDSPKARAIRVVGGRGEGVLA
jgi:hypothetical protein